MLDFVWKFTQTMANVLLGVSKSKNIKKRRMYKHDLAVLKAQKCH